jgi:hypothetical protein
MNILNKIKYQYNLKKLQDLISSEEYTKFFDEISKLSNNKSIFLQLLANLGVSALQKNNTNFFQNKIIWLNSFLKEDTAYVSKFMEYYMKELNQNIELTEYEKATVKELKKLENTKNLNFYDFLNYSYLYQYLILNQYIQNTILINELPFFSQANQLNFSKPTLTQCYFYIMDHPYSTYSEIKKNNSNDQIIAKNIFLNLDDTPTVSNIENVNIEIARKGWNIHVKSWTNENVINVLNGKVILKKDLEKDTYDVLSSIILHLIQTGSKIDLNYSVIEKFLEINPYNATTFDGDALSQKEKKFINQYVEEILKSYRF